MSGHTDKPSWAEILLDTSLTPTQRIVLLYLTWRQGGNGHAWPSQETIASDLSMTPEGVRRVILRLEEKGRLAVTRPKHTAPGVGYTYAVQHPTRVRVNTQPAVRVNTQPESLRHNNRRTPTLNTPMSEAIRLADLLLSLIVSRKPDVKRPNLRSWAEEIDRMIRIDKRTPARVEQVIRWSQADRFWQNNILSAAKLREKFDQLELKMTSSVRPQQDQSQPDSPAPVVRGPDGLTPRERLLRQDHLTKEVVA